MSKEWAPHKAAASLTHLMGVFSGPGTWPPDATWRACTTQRCEPCASAYMTPSSNSSLMPMAQLTAMLSPGMHGPSLTHAAIRWQVRVAAALSRIAAQGDQSFEGGEERVLKWDKARRDREKSSEGELLLFAYTPAFLKTR